MKLRLLSILLACLTLGLIAVLYFVLIPQYLLPENLRWLDFGVNTIVVALFTFNALKPMINVNDKSGTQAAGLGIRWMIVGWYAALALGMILIDLINAYQGGGNFSFKWQLFIQVGLLILLGIGIISSEYSTLQATDVSIKEEEALKGKSDLKAELSKLQFKAEDTKGLPGEIKMRLREAAGEMRFITPSTSAEATAADDRILEDCRVIHGALDNYDVNRRLIEEYVERLQRDIERRRKAY